MEKLKNYIKENKTKERIYFNGLSERTLQEKFDFIKNHDQYFIMNSWNGLKTISNNVKIYNFLNVEDREKYFELNEIDENFIFDMLFTILKDFEALTGYRVFSNGRSGGYLILCNKDNNENIIDNFINEYEFKYSDNLKQYKEDYDQSEWKNINNNITELYYLIKAFDVLCDNLAAELKYILKNFKIEEREEIYTKTIKEIIL